MNRRDLMKFSVLGAAALALPLERVVRAKSLSRIPSSKLPKPYTVGFVTPPVAVPLQGRADPTIDYFRITQKQTSLEILPGYRTEVFAYNGTVPGPTIIVPQGRRTVVQHRNELPGTHLTRGYTPWTSTHLHGSASLPQFDGYASDITQPGQGKNYIYPNFQPARTLWYHDHGVGHTAENVFSGLAAQYHMTDPLERSLAIPRGPYDLPLILGDAAFAVDGSLMYDDNNRSGFWGDVILVNGKPWPVMKVERRKYRFRILNACVSRGFRLTLSTGQPMAVIATDGGQMPKPQQITELRHGMAERYEVVIDFSQYQLGQRVELCNLGVKNAVDYDNTNKVMAFDVAYEPGPVPDPPLPAELNPNGTVMKLTEADATQRIDHLLGDVLGHRRSPSRPRTGDVSDDPRGPSCPAQPGLAPDPDTSAADEPRRRTNHDGRIERSVATYAG